jgi:outer membrane phospholipase A
MSRLNELIAQEIAEWEYLSGQAEPETEIEKEVSCDASNLRQMIHGKYAMAFFDQYPLFQSLQPKGSQAENNAEFAPVKKFYELLTTKTPLVHRLIHEATKACTQSLNGNV